MGDIESLSINGIVVLGRVERSVASDNLVKSLKALLSEPKIEIIKGLVGDRENIRDRANLLLIESAAHLDNPLVCQSETVCHFCLYCLQDPKSATAVAQNISKKINDSIDYAERSLVYSEVLKSAQISFVSNIAYRITKDLYGLVAARIIRLSAQLLLMYFLEYGEIELIPAATSMIVFLILRHSKELSTIIPLTVATTLALSNIAPIKMLLGVLIGMVASLLSLVASDKLYDQSCYLKQSMVRLFKHSDSKIPSTTDPSRAVTLSGKLF